MVPLARVPATLVQGTSEYRDVFCRSAGFEPVSRYVSGLLLSENRTLQGIAAQQMYRALNPSVVAPRTQQCLKQDGIVSS